MTQQVRELQTLPAEQLAARYETLFGKPPRVRNAAWLRRQVAWKIQERQHGGLSDRAITRLDELVAMIDLPIAAVVPPPRPRPIRAETHSPMVGTTLVRRWHDQDIRVEVRDAGFEWNGTLHRSLSAVARAITGSNWNGRLFFGLTTRSAAK